MAIATTNGQVMEAFSKMRIKHPMLDKAHELFDDLRHVQRTSRGRPQKFGAIFAPSQSGKSMSVQTYLETKVADELVSRGLFPGDMDRAEIARQQKVVLHVTLSAKATTKGLAADILAAFGDPASPRGTAQTLQRRVYDFCRHHKTELVCIDEVQHLDDRILRPAGDFWNDRAGIVQSTAVTDTLKRFLLEGLVPLVFVGLDQARHHIFNDVQMASRCYRELNFETIDLRSKEQKAIWFGYLGRLGLKLQQHDLFEDLTDLVSGDTPICLHEVAAGRLGMVTNVVMAASMIAREENATAVTREHLMLAVDAWAMPLRIIDYNPFRQGNRVFETKEAA